MFCYTGVVVVDAVSSSGPVADEGCEPLTLLQAAVRAFAEESCDGRDLATLRGEIEEMRRQMDLLEGEFVRRVGYVDRLREFFPDDQPLSMVGWLRNSCRLSGGAALERLEVARQLPELPATEEALSRGEIGYEHARVIARAATEMGPHVARVAEPSLIATAQEVDPSRLREVAQSVRHQIDPDGALAAALRHHERRRVRLVKKLDGAFLLDGQLDPEGGATLTTALNALMTPVPGDRRTSEQRRADAIVELARRQLQGGDLGQTAGQRPHLTLTVPASALRSPDAGPGDRLRGADGPASPSGTALSAGGTALSPGGAAPWSSGAAPCPGRVAPSPGGAAPSPDGAAPSPDGVTPSPGGACGGRPAGPEASGAEPDDPGADPPVQPEAACLSPVGAGTDPPARPETADGDRDGPVADPPVRPHTADADADGAGVDPPVRPETEADSGGAGVATLGWAGAVSRETARRIACDAAATTVVVGEDGTPLDVGRTTRTIPPALRRALVLRDKRCRFPGCDRPPEWTSAHHIRHWADGGPTNLSNLVLLCQSCHTYVHEHRWRLRWGDRGELVAEPP